MCRLELKGKHGLKHKFKNSAHTGVMETWVWVRSLERVQRKKGRVPRAALWELRFFVFCFSLLFFGHAYGPQTFPDQGLNSDLSHDSDNAGSLTIRPQKTTGISNVMTRWGAMCLQRGRGVAGEQMEIRGNAESCKPRDDWVTWLYSRHWQTVVNQP